MKNSSYNSELMYAKLMMHILSQKRTTNTLQTMRLQHLRLCTATCIPEPVNDNAFFEASDCSLACSTALTITRLMNKTEVSRPVNEHYFADLF